jgi:hypothetical protein
MSDETTNNFWAALVEPLPPPKPVFYRLYYTAEGLPLYYSMEDLPGNYIEIDQATFAQTPTNVRVVDNKLITIQPSVVVTKLTPNNKSGVACDPRDICIVVDPAKPHTVWSIKTNEIC